ncbi:12006_t:CDS:2 [Ambispora gerdemannii]|uniref:12006_t:CDS:1 n=1 Tax=Ambispora gerdemannii TaxID=144530 RepID=A0A9N8Z0X8_9GLOM|nr:12006_t:CDS:2 [Ambispora gerdemannii]
MDRTDNDEDSFLQYLNSLEDNGNNQSSSDIPTSFKTPQILKSQKNDRNYFGVKSQAVIQASIFLTKRTNTITVPKPFKFLTAERAQRNEGICNVSNDAKSPYTPLVKRIQAYLDETPDRFKPQPPVELPQYKYSSTVAKSPFLLTKIRAKPTSVLPTEEREAIEAEKHEFRARPVNRRIFEFAGELGVPTIEKLIPTIPESPKITKPKPVPPRKPSPPHLVKANPVPDYDNPFRPVIEHRKLFPPEFSLPGDEITKRKVWDREERIKRDLEEQERARRFRAQPLPSDSPDHFPRPPHQTPTQPNPFILQTDIRGEVYQQYFQEMVNRSEQIEKENKIFHARPVPNFDQVIPPPKPEKQNPTEPVEFNFLTDLRIEKHKQIEEERKRRGTEEKMLKKEKQREEEVRRGAEIRKLRSELVHHPEPIRRYTPLKIEPSKKRLTKATSPLIGEKRRRYLEESSNLSNLSFFSPLKSTKTSTIMNDYKYNYDQEQLQLTSISEENNSTQTSLQQENYDQLQRSPFTARTATATAKLMELNTIDEENLSELSEEFRNL